MANLQAQTISNGTVSVNGQVVYGGPSEFVWNGLKAKTSDYMALGMLGTTQTFDGFEAMDGTLKLMAYNSDVAAKFGDVTKAIQLSIRTNKPIFESPGRVAEIPMVYEFTATPKSIPGISLKAQEKAEFELEFSFSSVTIKENNVEILHFDVFSNAYRVGGLDKTANFRANLGI